eukprot:TRINITY_DN1810_c0_g1_i2.p1 TRINITY_DN1810_c0_g1~~TRINITY_DN1810_c0_g1_i2.p1  ORF type:complete len:231 (-),score=51.37 TRINITY_DN1810_c0_g1_i2:332-1024(-)
MSSFSMTTPSPAAKSGVLGALAATAGLASASNAFSFIGARAPATLSAPSAQAATPGNQVSRSETQVSSSSSAALLLLAAAGASSAALARGRAQKSQANVVRQAAAAPAVADFSSELGATPPLGFWDPLGLSKANDPNVAALQFKRRRIIEIQHGRVAMLATIGYIVPEYFRWPGYISPSMNVAFADIPNGLKGAAYIPGAGWRGRLLVRAGCYSTTWLLGSSWTQQGQRS